MSVPGGLPKLVISPPRWKDHQTLTMTRARRCASYTGSTAAAALRFRSTVHFALRRSRGCDRFADRQLPDAEHGACVRCCSRPGASFGIGHRPRRRIRLGVAGNRPVHFHHVPDHLLFSLRRLGSPSCRGLSDYLRRDRRWRHCTADHGPSRRLGRTQDGTHRSGVLLCGHPELRAVCTQT